MGRLYRQPVAAFVGGPLASREELLAAMLAGFGVIQARNRVERSSRDALVPRCATS